MKGIQQLKLGVLGGGQLGRMLIQSAVDFNIDVHILDPDPNAPCKDIATTFAVGDLKDFDTVYAFGESCDIISIEIENVNTKALIKLEKEGKKVFPQPHLIETIQDKRIQKQFYKDHKIPTAEFVLTENKTDVLKHKNMLPAVHKLGKEGYDGRGVQMIHTEADLDKAFTAPGVLEKLIPFEKEIAVIVARNPNGDSKTFPAVEMVFHPTANLVEYLISPAEISDKMKVQADSIARRVADEMGIVGLLAVEMFVTKEGEILVNEVAPRPHNSGHQTIEANITSQYEQHLRAIFNLPLGSTSIVTPSAMVNVLGAEGYDGIARYQGLDKVMAEKGVHVHLYGKKKTRPFRKMGHVTIVNKNREELAEQVKFVKRTLKVIADE